jgi:hypothetical protein
MIMQVYVEGTHFILPWFERPIIYDVRARPHLVESTSGSRDLQMVYPYLVSVADNCCNSVVDNILSCNAFTDLIAKI